MMPEDRKNGSCGNIMYKTMGVYVFIVTPLPVANLLTADNNDACKPPSFYTCGRYGAFNKTKNMRNILIALLSASLLIGCQRTEVGYMPFNDYVIADIINTNYPNSSIYHPQSQFFTSHNFNDFSDHFFFINNLDDFTEIITNRELCVVQQIDFESQTLVGYISGFVARSEFIDFTYNVRKKTESSTFKIEIILTNYGQEEDSRLRLNSAHWFILPKIDDSSQIEFDKIQKYNKLIDFDVTQLLNNFNGELIIVDKGFGKPNKTFNISTISDNYPNMIISSDIDGDTIELLGSIIFKYPNKIELFHFPIAYPPPLIITEYSFGSGLYLMETKELSLEFFRDNSNTDKYRFKGQIVNAP